MKNKLSKVVCGCRLSNIKATWLAGSLGGEKKLAHSLADNATRARARARGWCNIRCNFAKCSPYRAVGVRREDSQPVRELLAGVWARIALDYKDLFGRPIVVFILAVSLAELRMSG